MLRRLGAFILITAGLFLLLATSVGAFPPYHLARTPRTFYVDATEGADTNTGTAENQAWKTITKVNGYTFWPGDRVLFQRGETWTGTALLVAWSGAAGAPITFGSYGSGALPIVTYASAYAYLLSDGTTARNWITVDGIDFNGNNNANYGVRITGAHWVVQNCVLRSCKLAGIYMDAQGVSGRVHDVKILTNTVYGNMGSGGIHGEADAGTLNGVVNCLIEGNYIYSNGDAVGDHGIYLSRGAGNVVRKNTCWGNYDGGIKLNDQTSGPCAGGSVVELNYLHDNYCGIYVTAYGNTIRNNLSFSNTFYGLGVAQGSTNTVFAYNTVVSNGNCSLMMWTENVAGVTFKNNIFLQDTAAGSGKHPIKTSAEGEGAANTWDYNCVQWINNDTTVAYEPVGIHYTWADWQTEVSGEAHGINANPRFVTDYTNLHLSSTSPCSNTADSSIVAVEDKDDKNRGDGAPDMGCYEY